MYKFNISIDDVSPHPRSSLGVLDRCNELLEFFPGMKFSLFIPTAYWRVSRPGTITERPLFLSEYPEFCDSIKSLPKENFELGYHGHFHGKPWERSDNNEFYDIDYTHAKAVITAMLSEVDKAGLTGAFKPMIRPPNWRMSPAAFDACNDMGIDLFALTDIPDRVESHEGKNLVYRSVYSNYSPPNRSLKISEKCGVVFHACEWLKNYLDPEKAVEIKTFVEYYKNDIQFCFLESFYDAGEEDGQK